jgi:hypothetical protein
MRRSGLRFILLAMLLVACGPNFPAPVDIPEPLPKPEPAPSLTPRKTEPQPEPEPESPPRVVAAGEALSNWQAGNSAPDLAFDGQGRLDLFNQAVSSAGGYAYSQRQQMPDGTWTEPQPAAPDFQWVSNPTAIPGPDGRLCLLWSGEMFDKAGNAVDGLFRNCQKTDGTWASAAEQPVHTPSRTIFSLASAADGSLNAVYLTRAGPIQALFYSAIDPAAKGPLTGTQLSGKKQVLVAALAIDSKGGYHAIWIEALNDVGFTVQSRASTDAGQTWAEAEQLYSDAAADPNQAALQFVADAVGAVHLAWEGNDTILYRRWTAAGGWSELMTLSGRGRSSGVRLAVTKTGLAHVVWTTYASQSSVTLRVQTTNGAWGAPQTVSPTLARGLTLALDANAANHIVWNDDSSLRYVTIP